MAIKQVTAVQAMEEISKGKIITASLNEMQGKKTAAKLKT